jgi:transcriptional regulator with XRE-family HTH domain
MSIETSDKKHSRRVSRDKLSAGQPNKVDIHIGNRIRQRRLLLGWSQQYLGNLLGLTFQQVQKYEKGANRVSGSRLYDFAAVMQVGVEFFFQDMPEEIRNQSPRHIRSENAVVNQEAEDFITQNTDPMKSERNINLVRAFQKLPSPQIADKVYELLQLLSSSKWMLNKTDNTDSKKD